MVLASRKEIQFCKETTVSKQINTHLTEDKHTQIFFFFNVFIFIICKLGTAARKAKTIFFFAETILKLCKRFEFLKTISSL